MRWNRGAPAVASRESAYSSSTPTAASQASCEPKRSLAKTAIAAPRVGPATPAPMSVSMNARIPGIPSRENVPSSLPGGETSEAS